MKFIVVIFLFLIIVSSSSSTVNAQQVEDCTVCGGKQPNDECSGRLKLYTDRCCGGSSFDRCPFIKTKFEEKCCLKAQAADDPSGDLNTTTADDPSSGDLNATAADDPSGDVVAQNMYYRRGNNIPHFTGALSMIGSAYIIFDVLRDWRKRLRKPYSRILMVLSIFDFFASFCFMMGAWIQPSSEYMGRGNKQTCTASGFFIQLGIIAIPLYNATLSIQSFLTIQRSWNEGRVWKDFERYAHLCIILCAFTLAIVPLFMDLYNPWLSYCAVTPAKFDPETQQRAAGSIQLTNLVVVLMSAIVVTALMISVYCAVRKVTRRASAYEFSVSRPDLNSSSRFSFSRRNSDPSSRFSFSRRNSDTSNRSTDLGSRSINRRSSTSRRMSNVQRVKTLALLYSIPFYLTWVIPSIIFLLTNPKTQLAQGKHKNIEPSTMAYIEKLYILTVFPLQGFLNGCIYFYRRYTVNNFAWGKTTTNRLCSLSSRFGLLFRRFCCCCCKERRKGQDNTDENVSNEARDESEENKIVVCLPDSTCSDDLGDDETGSAVDDFEENVDETEEEEKVKEANNVLVVCLPEDNSGDIKDDETGSAVDDFEENVDETEEEAKVKEENKVLVVCLSEDSSDDLKDSETGNDVDDFEENADETEEDVAKEEKKVLAEDSENKDDIATNGDFGDEDGVTDSSVNIKIFETGKNIC